MFAAKIDDGKELRVLKRKAEELTSEGAESRANNFEGEIAIAG
ncbi:MAG: hypothetical protein NWE98_00150 [Candidatus Bathyarchaeota archaeon]|nr:hypothetical protein [Candidatus Bathyarchaeota archaeon]